MTDQARQPSGVDATLVIEITSWGDERFPTLIQAGTLTIAIGGISKQLDWGHHIEKNPFLNCYRFANLRIEGIQVPFSYDYPEEGTAPHLRALWRIAIGPLANFASHNQSERLIPCLREEPNGELLPDIYEVGSTAVRLRRHLVGEEASDIMALIEHI
jgi:hypothetical protein